MYKIFGWIFIILGIIFGGVVVIFINYNIAFLDQEKLSNYGSFIGGTIGVLFSLAGYLLVFEGLRINKKHQFENTFFSLVNSFNEFRTKNIGMEYKKNDDEIPQHQVGYMFFEILMHKQINSINKEIATISDEHIGKQMEIHKSQLSQFFGQINMIIYKIDNSKLKVNEKMFYIAYLHSILSEIELFLIKKYYLIFPEEKFKFLKQIDKIKS